MNKKIKAWAVVDDVGEIKQVNAFEECPQCGDVGTAIGLYPIKADAEAFASKWQGEKVIRVSVEIKKI